MDPAGPDVERSCCSPSAVVAARQTCHDRGLPHITLDLREEFRRAVVTPFIRGYAKGETPNPCIRCNGGFRFAELLAFARRVGAPRLATGHYARIVEHRGRRLLARARDARKDQSYMLARLDPRQARARVVPARRPDQGRDARRGRGCGAGGRAAAREPGGVFPRRRRLPRVSRPARARRDSRRHRRRGAAAASARTTGTGGSRRASGAGSASRRQSRSMRSRPMRGRTRSRSGRGARSPGRASRRGGGSSPRPTGSR